MWREHPEVYNRFRCNWTGRHHSDETKKKMSEKAKLRPKEKNCAFGKVWIHNDLVKKNALIKAKAAAKLTTIPVISDDSGIEIEFLDGFPGVFTKRWHAGTDRERNIEIIKKLNGVEKSKRKVTFTTAIALAEGDTVYTGIAKIYGYIAENVRGNNGFGFDEIFELENGKTLAELTPEEKNQISARKKALEIIKSKLK